MQEHRLLAELGRAALDAGDPGAFLERAVVEIAAALHADGCVLLELAGEDELFEVARVGPAQALRPHPIEALHANQTRLFPSGICVVVPGRERPFGVLGVYTRDPSRFTAEHAARLESAAGLLATAIWRIRTREELARANSELSRTNALLEAVTNDPAIPDLVYVKDREGRFVWLNRAATELLRLATPEPLGKRDRDVIPPELAERIRAVDVEVMTTARPSERTEVIQIAGRTRAYQSVKMPLREDGQVTGVIGHSREVTREREMEEQMRASHARYEDLFENAPDPYLTVDARQGAITQVNRATCALFKMEREELIGRPCASLCAPGSVASARALLERMRHVSRVDDVELTLEDREGQRVDVSVNVTALRDGKGALEGGRVVLRDITRRRRAEHRLRVQHEVTKVLAESRTIEDAAPRLITALAHETGWDVGGLWKVDPVARVLRCVELWHRPDSRVAGIVDEMKTVTFAEGTGSLGRSWTHGGPVWVEDLMTESNVLRSELFGRAGLRSGIGIPIACGGEVLGVVELLSHRERKPDVELLEHMRSIAGQIGQFIERKRAEDRLAQAQKVEAVGRLAGGVAHDFNNLLTVIVGYSDLMKGEVPPGHPLRQPLQEISESARRAANLTQHLLIVSRKKPLHPVSVDVNALIEDMLPTLEAAVGEGVRLEVCLEPALRGIEADTGQLETVLIQLATNAAEAMPGGGVLRLETSNADLDAAYSSRRTTVKPGRYVRITVSDSGVGMDARTQERIFDPFFTTKGIGQGGGLGLSVVEGIVVASGGHIWLYSEPGHGTTFKLYFPARSDGGVPVRPPRTSTGERGAETVLVVEDEDRLRKLLVEVLRSRGYTVLEAANGEEALLLHEDHGSRVDLLLTDVMMPGLKGPDVAARLRERDPSIRTMYMSGYTDQDIVDRGFLTAEVPFLSKPFALDTLLRKVRQVLDASAQDHGPTSG